MADSKKRESTAGRQLRAILTFEQMEKRNEIKLMLSSLTGKAFGRVLDSELIGKALEIYHDLLVVKKQIILPDGDDWELLEHKKPKKKSRKPK